MDIQKYIASGILEQYVLGNTTAAESQQVERYVLEYPEIAAELEAIQSALEQWALLEGREPRAEVEEALMQKVDAGATVSEEEAPLSEAAGSGRSVMAILLAALLFALGVLVYQFLKFQEVQSQFQEQQLELEQLRKDCAALQDTTTVLLNYAQIVGNPNSQHVLLAGQAIAPTSVASVYWNPTDQKSYLEIKNLPPPPPNMQYQLWAIVEGNPVDMGVFDLADGLASLTEVPFVENPEAFGVTLEKKRGKPCA